VSVDLDHTFLKSPHTMVVRSYLSFAGRFEQAINSVTEGCFISGSGLSGSVYCGTLDGVMMQVNFYIPSVQ